jgi:hypothetical protein
MPAGEPSRFGEFDSEMGLWQLGGGAESVTFFPGAGFNKRMDEVRQAISDIRLHWDQYPQFTSELRTFLGKVPEPSVRSLEEQEGVPEFSARSREFEAYWDEGRGRVEALLSSRKEWPELRGGPGNDDYSAIRLYTSIYGYMRMFGAMNSAFRRSDITRDPAEIRAVTLLVELLNIDLYSYIRANPEADNFEGRVYRGNRCADHSETYGLAADSDKYRNAAAEAYGYFSANI